MWVFEEVTLCLICRQCFEICLPKTCDECLQNSWKPPPFCIRFLFSYKTKNGSFTFKFQSKLSQFVFGYVISLLLLQGNVSNDLANIHLLQTTTNSFLHASLYSKLVFVKDFAVYDFMSKVSDFISVFVDIFRL